MAYVFIVEVVYDRVCLSISIGQGVRGEFQVRVKGRYPDGLKGAVSSRCRRVLIASPGRLVMDLFLFGG